MNPEYSGRDIHAEAAWAITTGNSEIVVAVIDTGVDYDHDDLQGNLWGNLNEGENPDSQDNDLNGFVDDLNGWNFISGNRYITDDNTDMYEFVEDEYGGHYECVTENTYHGTHTAGIIGAVANNTKGISGVCWNIKIMPIKAFNYCGQTTTPILINALDYATSNGAFLTSNSYHIFGFSQAYREAVQRALSMNRLLVAAAGNGYGTNIDNNPRYPISFSEGNVIGVLSTAIDDKMSSFSDYGPNSVDLGAPGEDIWSLKLGDDYQQHSGTSMATPFVAGVAGLALGLCPGLTYDRLKDLIIDGADYVSDLNNKCVSEGRLNAYNVLDGLGGASQPDAPSNLIANPLSWYIVGLRWNDNSDNEVGFEIQRKYQGQAAFIHHNSKDMNATSYVYYQEIINPTRSYTYRVRAANKAGISSFSTCNYSVPQTAPEAPTDLNGQSPVLELNVNIYWTNHGTNTLYNYIERRIPGETDWEEIATVGYNVDSYSDNYALAGHTYQYRVKAGNPIGSSYSNVISIEVIDW